MSENTPAVRDSASLERYVGPRTWQELIAQASRLYASGLLPKSIRSVEATIAVIQTGRELQLNPMEAFRNIHVIEGVPTVSPKCKLGLIQRSGLLSDLSVTDGDGFAECTMKRRGMSSPVTFRFTMEEARAAGLTNKSNWKSWPKNMLRWRVIGFVADVLFSDVTGGHFTPDELGAVTDSDGVPIESPETNLEDVAVLEQQRLAERVKTSWNEALRSGWSDADLGRWFSQRGVRKKSEISAELLDQFEAAVRERSGETVDATDWTNDPALEGL